MYIGYPAKLMVNKQVVQDEFPQWNFVLQSSRVAPPTQTDKLAQHQGDRNIPLPHTDTTAATFIQNVARSDPIAEEIIADTDHSSIYDTDSDSSECS